jgi:Ulp1 family protease
MIVTSSFPHIVLHLSILQERRSCKAPKDLFDLKHVLVPVGMDNHWSLFVIMNPKAAVRKDEGRVVMAHIDSANTHPTAEIASNLKR